MALKSRRDDQGNEVVTATGRDKGEFLGAFRERCAEDADRRGIVSSSASPRLAMPEVFCGFDADGRVIYSNPDMLSDPVKCGDGWVEGAA